jgi:hypothetical protein
MKLLADRKDDNERERTEDDDVVARRPGGERLKSAAHMCFGANREVSDERAACNKNNKE